MEQNTLKRANDLDRVMKSLNYIDSAMEHNQLKGISIDLSANKRIMIEEKQIILEYEDNSKTVILLNDLDEGPRTALQTIINNTSRAVKEILHDQILAMEKEFKKL